MTNLNLHDGFRTSYGEKLMLFIEQRNEHLELLVFDASIGGQKGKVWTGFGAREK